MTSTMAKRVSMFRVKPTAYMNAKVPTSDTMMDTAGMSVARKSWRNTNTTRTTNTSAMTSVSTTLWIDASRKSLVLDMSVSTIPGGNVSRMLSSVRSISTITSLALEPAVWAIMAFAPGWPLVMLSMA